MMIQGRGFLEMRKSFVYNNRRIEGNAEEFDGRIFLRKTNCLCAKEKIEKRDFKNKFG